MEISFDQITFSSKFDSGNLARVEQVCITSDQKQDGYIEDADYVFNLWTSPDASGTSYENGNRTWFYFSIYGPVTSRTIKFTIMNLNRQSRLYKQGLTPFYISACSRVSSWQRIKEKPTFETVDGNFQLTFIHKFSDSAKNYTTYFAFCYPFSYSDCQKYLSNLQESHSLSSELLKYQEQDIYFHRDTLIRSIDCLNVDLLTVTSMRGMTEIHENTILGLYPDEDKKRARIFRGKKVFFLTSRVHPGETQASYVFNGFLDFILRKNDKRAIKLRDLFVFKMVPMLNPDGVKRGHYRTDTYGANLNRTYIDPNIFKQPTIFAIKTLMLYHHFNRKDPKLCAKGLTSSTSEELVTTTNNANSEVIHESLTFPCLNHCYNEKRADESSEKFLSSSIESNEGLFTKRDKIVVNCQEGDQEKIVDVGVYDLISVDEKSNDLSESICDDIHTGFEKLNIDKDHEILESEKFDEGIDFYIDLHGHATKRGCFVYGNYVDNEKDMVDCMLYPKLISLNSSNFDFSACDFNERNMYHKDRRDGLSKEGSGRVSVFKTLGIIHSYTLECNYNTGRTTNFISPATGDDGRATPPPASCFPPKYSTDHYEEIGKATAISLLDFYNCNPWSRLPSSQYKSLSSVREWVKKYMQNPPVKNFPQVKGLKQNKTSTKINQDLLDYKKQSTSTVTPSATSDNGSPPKISSPKKINMTGILTTKKSILTPTSKDQVTKAKHPSKLFQNFLLEDRVAIGDKDNHNSSYSKFNIGTTTRFSFGSIATRNCISSGASRRNSFPPGIVKESKKKDKHRSGKRLLSCKLPIEKLHTKTHDMIDDKLFEDENQITAVSCKLTPVKAHSAPATKKKKRIPSKITKKPKTLKPSLHIIDSKHSISSKVKSSSEKNEKKEMERITTAKKKSNKVNKKKNRKKNKEQWK